MAGSNYLQYFSTPYSTKGWLHHTAWLVPPFDKIRTVVLLHPLHWEMGLCQRIASMSRWNCTIGTIFKSINEEKQTSFNQNAIERNAANHIQTFFCSHSRTVEAEWTHPRSLCCGSISSNTFKKSSSQFRQWRKRGRSSADTSSNCFRKYLFWV